jgi:hypothetical protein
LGVNIGFDSEGKVLTRDYQGQGAAVVGLGDNSTKLKLISDQQDKWMDEAQFRQANAALASQLGIDITNLEPDQFLAQLRQKLNLPESATEDQVNAKLNEMRVAVRTEQEIVLKQNRQLATKLGVPDAANLNDEQVLKAVATKLGLAENASEAQINTALKTYFREKAVKELETDVNKVIIAFTGDDKAVKEAFPKFKQGRNHLKEDVLKVYGPEIEGLLQQLPPEMTKEIENQFRQTLLDAARQYTIHFRHAMAGDKNYIPLKEAFARGNENDVRVVVINVYLPILYAILSHLPAEEQKKYADQVVSGLEKAEDKIGTWTEFKLMAAGKATGKYWTLPKQEEPLWKTTALLNGDINTAQTAVAYASQANPISKAIGKNTKLDGVMDGHPDLVAKAVALGVLLQNNKQARADVRARFQKYEAYEKGMVQAWRSMGNGESGTINRVQYYFLTVGQSIGYSTAYTLNTLAGGITLGAIGGGMRYDPRQMTAEYGIRTPFDVLNSAAVVGSIIGLPVAPAVNSALGTTFATTQLPL